MTYNKPIPVTSAELEQIEREEAEALERMAMRAEEPPPEKVDEILAEIEKLAAADLVMLLRHANTSAIRRNEIERARIAQAGRKLAAELLDGCRKFERYRPDGDVPEFLRAGSDVPMLRCKAD